MKKRKGFTLVELLAVIAILAILVIIALPNVLKMFREAKENTFTREIQNIMRSADDKYVSSSIGNRNNNCFDSSTNTLNLDGRSNIIYVVKFNDKGKITELRVADESYQLIAENESGINKSEIGKNYKVEALNPKTIIIGCDNTALKQESEDKELVIKKDNEEIRTIQMGMNTTTTIEKESDLGLIYCNNGVEVKEENGQLKLSNIFTNSVCIFSNNLSNVVSNLGDTENNILLINDLNIDSQVIIDKKLTIDMNGKSINSSFDGDAIKNKSNLTIKNESESESSIVAIKAVIRNLENAKLNLEKVNILSKDSDSVSAIHNNGKLIVKNSHIEGPHGIGDNFVETSTFDIYDSQIVGTLENGITLNGGSASNGNIYNSIVTGKYHAISSGSSGIINIYSGTFTGENTGILNRLTGTINICSGEISGVTYDLNNTSTGIINYTSKVTLKNGTINGTNINLTDNIVCK